MARASDPATRPLILVTGATGAQGGSVAHHLLRRGRFAVRGLTRKPDSPAARALEKLGAEMVRGDLSDVATLKSALAGCYGAYGVTNYWEHFAAEYQQGVNLVDAVAASDVRHFVFSTLPSVVDLTGGEFESPHFDIKARLEAYARGKRLPATYVQMAFYYDNFLAFFPPRRQEDGSYRIGFPQGDTLLAGVATEDVGGVVAAIFEQRDDFLGKTLYIVGDDLTASEYAAIMGRVTGQRVTYAHIPRETFAGFGFPGAEDLANMFEFYRTRVPNRRSDLERSRKLFPGIQSFAAWADRHRAELAAALG